MIHINVMKSIKMASKFKIQHRERNIENTEKAKSSFSKECIEIADW